MRACHLAVKFVRWWAVACKRDFATERADIHSKSIAATAWDAALETARVVELPTEFAQAVELCSGSGLSDDEKHRLRVVAVGAGGDVAWLLELIERIGRIEITPLDRGVLRRPSEWR